MFWDDQLQAAAIQAFLDATGIFRGTTLFENGKMTDQFLQLYQSRGKLSHGERLIVETAMDFWNGDGNVRLNQLTTLSSRHRELIFSLYQALCHSAQAVQNWIESQPRSK